MKEMVEGSLEENRLKGRGFPGGWEEPGGQWQKCKVTWRKLTPLAGRPSEWIGHEQSCGDRCGQRGQWAFPECAVIWETPGIFAHL